ncbi:MAG: ATP-binding protein [Chlorobi bacterium]|nr:ATP-binding protein [Chlorobiota bacterium]
MLVDFFFKNYASFKEEQHFSFLASPRKEKFPKNEDNIAVLTPNLKLLKSAVVYGANASGKSNFLNAFNIFKQLVFSFGNINGLANSLSGINHFLLSDKSYKEPTLFEITFFIKGEYFRYGIEFTADEIIEEWLYRKVKREALVFHRKKDNTAWTKHIPEKYSIIRELWKKKMVRKEALLLTVAAQFNDPLASEIQNAFRNLNVISGIRDVTYKNFTINIFSDDKQDYKKKIVELLKLADFGIDSILTKEIPGETVSVSVKGLSDDSPEILRQKTTLKNLFSLRKIYSEKGEITGYSEMKFDVFESEGTKKFFHLLGPILDTLKDGKILIIDELDTKLHPMLTKQIIKLFRNPVTNPHNAQLIFATHDINLLEAKLFRRDQIWFTEKNRFGASQLFALTDFKKGVRNDDNISKHYMEGRYGAIPYLADFKEYFEKQPE